MARPALQALVDRFGETAVLSVRDGGDVVVLDQVVTTGHVVIVQCQPGMRHLMPQAAHGRCHWP